MTDFAQLKKAGAVALSLPEKNNLTAEFLLDVMCCVAEHDMTLYCPVSGNSFSQKGAVNAGRISGK